MEVGMKKVTIRIQRRPESALRDMGDRFAKAWKAGKSGGATLEFESPSALFRVLTPRRWDMVERLQAVGPTSIRGLARTLERDVKRVHEDVAALLEYGLIARSADGKYHVPYDVVHAEFDLKATA